MTTTRYRIELLAGARYTSETAEQTLADATYRDRVTCEDRGINATQSGWLVGPWRVVETESQMDAQERGITVAAARDFGAKKRSEAARRFAHHLARATAALDKIRACLTEPLDRDAHWAEVGSMEYIANKLDQVVEFLGVES